MRPVFKIRRNAGQPRRLHNLVVVASGMAIGLRYCRLAQRDEQNGFCYTAALEWRKAAELLRPFEGLAGRCWQEWERIMQMPRRLAIPLSADEPAITPMTKPEPPTETQPLHEVQRHRFGHPSRFALSCWQRLRAHQVPSAR